MHNPSYNKMTFTNTYTKNLSTYIVSWNMNGGTGTGTYAVVASVSIQASAPETGKQFSGWTQSTSRIPRSMPTGDIPAGAAHQTSPMALTAKTIFVKGYTDGTVRPDANITRAETATMLFRLLTEEHRAEILITDVNFLDIPADVWYREAVATMANGGYILGYSDGSFGGDNSITRAEFVAMLVRFIGIQEAECSFPDVSADHWTYTYIATASNADWITGDDSSTFRLDDPITRAEAMAIINRVLNRGVNQDSTLLEFKQ